MNEAVMELLRDLDHGPVGRMTKARWEQYEKEIRERAGRILRQVEPRKGNYLDERPLERTLAELRKAGAFVDATASVAAIGYAVLWHDSKGWSVTTVTRLSAGTGAAWATRSKALEEYDLECKMLLAAGGSK